MKTKKRFIQVLLLVCLLPLTACAEKGRGERAGERVDEIIDNVKDGDAPLKKKGAFEKVGESIDDSVSDGK